MREDYKEIIRQIVGAVRPEIREVARKLVDFLPPQLRKEWVGRIVGFLAQRLEKMDLAGFQEVISDAVEIISDEISKQIREKKVRNKEIDMINEVKRILENARERLMQAENVEDEKDRIIAELEAYQTITEVFKKIEEKYVPKEERKINWEKVFLKIGGIIKDVKEKGLEGLNYLLEKTKEKTSEAKREFLEGLKEGWQKGRRRGLI